MPFSGKLTKAVVTLARAQELLADIEKAKWSKKYINDLPDSAFLIIESGGEKDGDGKTTPRSLRHFPVRDADGKLDLPHLRNALSRIPQSKLPQAVKDKAKSKAQRLLSSSTEKAATDAIDKARRMVKPKPMYKDDMSSGDLASGGKLVPGRIKNPKMPEPSPKAVVNGIQRTSVSNLSVVAISRKFDIVKFAKADTASPDERYILGVVLEPETEDAQHDIYDEETIRKTAHDFMANHQVIGLQHKGTVDDRVKILESYLAPCDFEMNGQTIKKGTWMLAGRVEDDTLWQNVKDGSLTGWSIGGSAIRTPEEDATNLT